MTDSQEKRKSKASAPPSKTQTAAPANSLSFRVPVIFILIIYVNLYVAPKDSILIYCLFLIKSALGFFFCSFQPALPFDVLTDRFWVWMQLCISTIEISQFKLHSKTPFACDHLKTHLSFWLMVSLKHVLKGSLADTFASVSICPCTYLLFKQVSHLALVCCQPGRFLSSQRHETSAICF